MDNRIAFARSLRKAMTPEEVKLWVRLRTWRGKGYHFRRQAPIDGYVLDFVCKSHKPIVEVDGSQHGEDRGRARDEKRDAHFRAKGYRAYGMPTSIRIPMQRPTRSGRFCKGKTPSLSCPTRRCAPPSPFRGGSNGHHSV
ncbi:endonuclease domain-containing protein [Nordella sp. HKS 07]|uniref:endonuclease domain-containing protein n=1 Tax=Nordella sp. HKS 07 TaxID=2712222 RepID=UPI001FEDD920|nr:DUF559 domain-containing protein [Nordella sp. HKS 07]